MGTADEPSTSLTLLGALCDPAKGDRGWQAFCDRYQPLIQRWCSRWRLQPADVDDVTQKVLYQLVSRIKSYQPQRGGFRPWLQTVVKNALHNLHRHRERHPDDQAGGDNDMRKLLEDIEAPETVEYLAGELNEKIGDELQSVIARVQARIDTASWQIYLQIELEGKTRQAAAAALGKTYTAVCMVISRVRKMLAEEWARLHSRQ
jgi:RNA polymerase sigma factor (sigma-70 family)